MSRGFLKISEKQWESSVKGIGLPIVLYDDIVLPFRKTNYSAGYDIFSTVSITLEPNMSATVPLGWKVYMQPNEYLAIVPRSGLGFKYYTRLANTIGIIDYDYFNNETNEGHCFMKLRNEGDVILHINRGDGIAQAIFMNYLLADDDNYNKGFERKGGLGHTG